MAPREFALFRNNFIPLSETFIHDELRFHERYRGVVFARRKMNEAVYPGHEVHTAEGAILGDRSPGSLLYGLTGLYPPFFKTFRERDFGLVHAHFGHNGLYAMPYARSFGLPLVVSLHGRDVTILIGPDRRNPEFFYYTLRKRQLFSQGTLFLAASTELKELIIEAGCPEEKVVVHRLGIDTTLFTPPESLPGGDPLVVMVGRFVAKKGFALGLRAFAAALSRGAKGRLLLIGDGPQREELTTLTRALGIEHLVDMPGQQPHDAVVEAMSRAWVVITPSLVAPNMDRESGLIVAKEAQACGVPVLAHWHGGLPDIVDDGKTGYLYPERDVESMARGLHSVLTSARLRHKLGSAARKKMVAEYDIRHANERLEHLYDEVCNGRRRW